MKALDVYYLDFKDTTCITVPSLKFKVGQKISDDQGNIFEIKGLSTFSGLTARRDVSNLIVQGKFEGNTVTLLQHQEIGCFFITRKDDKHGTTSKVQKKDYLWIRGKYPAFYNLLKNTSHPVGDEIYVELADQGAYDIIFDGTAYVLIKMDFVSRKHGTMRIVKEK